MAKLAVLNDSNQPIGDLVPVNDAMITFVRRVVGGATNAETVNAFWDAAVPVLRRHFLEERVAQLRAPTPAQTAAEVAAVTEVNEEWPAVG